MSRISSREAAILGLVCESPRYGYELEKIIQERGMRTWTEIGFSSIYYVLKLMEKKGLIQSTIEDMEGKPSRRIYSVTEKGLNAMKEKVKAVLSCNTKLISPFDLGIAYHYLLNPEGVLECLRLYLKSLDEREDFLERSIQEKEKENNYRAIALFSRPLAHVRIERAWVEKFIKEVEEKRDNHESTT